MLIIALVGVFSVGYSLGIYVDKSTSTVEGDYLKTFKTVYGILNNRFFFREDSEEYREKLINDAIKGLVDGQGETTKTSFALSLNIETIEFIVVTYSADVMQPALER